MDAIAREMSGANFDLCSSSVILLEMWEKWVFLATIAGMTCLCVVRLEISSRLVLRIWRSSFWGVQRRRCERRFRAAVRVSRTNSRHGDNARLITYRTDAP